MKIKKITNVEASFTVEASLIIIFVFAVIFLELFFAFFLHDKIVMENLITEVAITSDEIDDAYLQEKQKKAEALTLCLHNIVFTYKDGFIKDKIAYNAIVKVPLFGVVGVLLRQSGFQITGMREVNSSNPYQLLCSCGKEK